MPRTASELRTFADDHLLYEIDMAAALTARLRRYRAHLADGVAIVGDDHRELLDLAGRNADIEALAMHVRVLVAFFYGARQADSATANDYFEGRNGWSSGPRPQKPRSLERINPRVGEEIAHLSYRRTNPAKHWDYEQIWRDIVPIIRVFADNASSDRLSARFRERVQSITTTEPLADPLTIGRRAALAATLAAPETTFFTTATQYADAGGTVVLNPQPSTPDT